MSETTTKKVGRPKTKKVDETNDSTKKIEKNETVEIKNTQKKRQIVDIDRNALIPCKSVVYGQLTYVSPRTNIPYRWNDYGAVEMIEFGELTTMRASYPKFLNKPWILIDDDEIVEYFRLQDMYEKLLPLDDIETFLQKPFNEIEALFSATSLGMKQTFATKITELVNQDKISDIRIVTMIDKALGTGIKEFI